MRVEVSTKKREERMLMSSIAITSTSIVNANPSSLSCNVEGEAVILQLETGVYHGLDPVGAYIWSLLQEPKKVSAVRDQLLEEYDVTPESCERDLLKLFEKMAAENLITVRDGEDT
jgi:hypothetical protein